MNSKDFIKEISKRSDLHKSVVTEVYNISGELIAEKLIAGEDVDIPKIGKFVIRKKNAKNLFGSQNNDVKICIYPFFKICDHLKERVKNACRYKKSS